MANLPLSPYGSKVLGTGSAYPARRLTNHDLSRTIDTTDAWIVERTGIHERRIAQAGNDGERNSTLGFLAAQRALEMAGKRAEDIDQIVYATCSPDTLLPSTACWLQKKLGATRAWGMDVNAACSGFVFAMATADNFIRAGQAKTSLVVGADVLSPYVDWSDRGSCILFGDGAGAIVLERTENSDAQRILSSHLRTDGELWELFYIPAGGSARPASAETVAQGQHFMKMKGREIFKVAVRMLADYATEALESNGLRIADLDWMIPHQANLRIIEAVAKRLGFPMERVLVNIDRYGNTSAATVPTAFDEAVRGGRIRRGQTVLLDVFGAGLSYGSLLLRF